MTELPPRILAIDLALGKTGIACCGRGFDTPIVWTFSTGTKKGHEREAAIIAELRRAVNLCRPEVVLLEDVYVPTAGRLGEGFLGLAFMHGVVRYYLSGVAPWGVINNTHIKIFATGQGTKVDKHSVMLNVERRYGHLVRIEDDNQADAFMLLAMGRQHYGHPLSTMDTRPVPQSHLRALEMVKEWPKLTHLES